MSIAGTSRCWLISVTWRWRAKARRSWPVGDAIVHAHFSDHKPFLHTNQVIGTGFTRTKDYLDELRRMKIDRRVKRFGYDELVISFELGVPGDRIGDPEDWVKRSIQHIQQIAPDMTLSDG